MSRNPMLKYVKQFGLLFALISIFTLLTFGVPGMEGLISGYGTALVENHEMYEAFTQQTLDEQLLQEKIDESNSYVILAITVFSSIIISTAVLFMLVVTIISNYLQHNVISLKKIWRITFGMILYFLVISPIIFVFLLLVRSLSVSNWSLVFSLPATVGLLYIYFQLAINMVLELRQHKLSIAFTNSAHLLKNKWIIGSFIAAMLIYMASYLPQNAILAFISTSAFYSYLFVSTNYFMQKR